MDPRQVIHIGSFSKTLAPALRLGYVVADWEVMSRLVACKRETDSGTGALEQIVVAEYFSQSFGQHIAELTQVLGDKLDTMVDALEEGIDSSEKVVDKFYAKYKENLADERSRKAAEDRARKV